MADVRYSWLDSDPRRPRTSRTRYRTRLRASLAAWDYKCKRLHVATAETQSREVNETSGRAGRSPRRNNHRGVASCSESDWDARLSKNACLDMLKTDIACGRPLRLLYIYFQPAISEGKVDASCCCQLCARLHDIPDKLQSTLLLRLQLQVRILRNCTYCRRKHCSLRRLVLRLEVIANLLHCHPLDSLLGVDVLDDTSSYQYQLQLRGEGSKEAAYRSSKNNPCGCPQTSGCTVTGKTNSSSSR